MTELQYPRQVLQNWYELQEAKCSEEELELLIKIFEAVFFASLGQEEGTPTRLNVIYTHGGAPELRQLLDTSELFDKDNERELAWDVVELQHLPFDVSELIKIAPATDVRRNGVVVGFEFGKLQIQGIARRRRMTNGGAALVFTVVAAGAVIVSRGGEELLRYEHGRKIDRAPLVFDKGGPVLEFLHSISAEVASSMSQTSPWYKDDVVRTVVGLVEKMASTGHGGIIGILPKQAQWALQPKYTLIMRSSLNEAIRTVLKAEVQRWHALLSDAQYAVRMSEATAAELAEHQAEAELSECIKDLGQFTGVDNALLFTHDLTVIGAGCPLNATALPEVFEAHDERGKDLHPFDLSRFGSRHRAAACFAKDTKGLAFVASEDGPLRCMLWHNEKVLLWRFGLQNLL